MYPCTINVKFLFFLLLIPSGSPSFLLYLHTRDVESCTSKLCFSVKLRKILLWIAVKSTSYKKCQIIFKKKITMQQKWLNIVYLKNPKPNLRTPNFHVCVIKFPWYYCIFRLN